MQWYNYKAFALNSPLMGPAIMETSGLENFICDISANTPMYHCYYDLEKRPSFVNYEGLARPVFNTIHLDLDSKDDEGLAAWEDTKKLCLWLRSQNVDYVLYFSGNKGFHVAVHMSAFGLTEGPVRELEAKVKAILFSLKVVYPTLDTGIWNANRKFRAFRSHHEKSSLYKIRLDSLELSLTAIRNQALRQPDGVYKHPAPAAQALALEFTATIPQPQVSKKQYKEATLGAKEDDSSLQFKSFASKLCIKDIESRGSVPSLNRHDVGLRLIYDMFHIGVSFQDAGIRLDKWALKVFPTEPDRAADMRRQLADAYSNKPQTYNFGCYDDVKKIFCSAKCKLYADLTPRDRAHTVDANKTQKAQNKASLNPNSELSESELADNILTEFPKLCKASGQYFQWLGTHWKRIDGALFEDTVLKMAIKSYGGTGAGIRKIQALADHVLAKIFIAPESNNFFNNSQYKFNFSDGTAWVLSDSKGKLNVELRPHSDKDYLSYCAPFPLYGDHGLKRGTEFKKYLDIRLGDVGPDGVRIIKQMLGAALIPYVPRIFFIEGVTNAGKSTLAKLIMKLLGPENFSDVIPVIRGGGADRFNWAPSVGKIANIVIELPDYPVDTNTLKMVRDKTPVSMDRKGKDHVKATLPFLHIYCCNSMPASFEGNSGALNNRVTMLYFKPGYLNGSSDVVEYADHIWADDAGGVLEAAREGLADLMASGFKYHESGATKEAVKEWQMMTDPVSSYFEDIRKSEWPVPQGLEEDTNFQKGNTFYKDFKIWCQESGRKTMGKKKFYQQLTRKLNLPYKARSYGGERWDFTSAIKMDTLEGNVPGSRVTGIANLGSARDNASIVTY